MEQKNAIIESLEKRLGPIYVDEDSDSRSASVSPVTHEVTQKDDLFAKNFTYTTNVNSLLWLLFIPELISRLFNFSQEIVKTI